MQGRHILWASSLPLTLSGCSGAFWGNLVVLGVTFGIFFGTLTLGRGEARQARSAESSASSSSSTPS